MAKPVTKLLTVIALTAPAAATPPTAPTAPAAGARAAVDATAASPQPARPAVIATTPTASPAGARVADEAPGRPGWFAAQLRIMRGIDLFRASAPRTLASGAPACGNVMTKGPRPACEAAAVVAERAR